MANTILTFLLGGLICGSGYYGVVGTASGVTSDVNLLSIGPTGAGTAVDQGNGSATSGTLRVTIASNSTGVISQGSNPWSVRLQDGSGNTIASTSNALNVNVTNTNANGQATMANSSPVVIASNQSTVPVSFGTVTSTGMLTSYTAAAASTNATNVKNSAGTVYMLRAFNVTSTAYYLRMYNLSTSPTCSSATGFIESIPIPASTTGAGFVIPQSVGQDFATGIGFCITGGAGSTDNTNAATGVFVTVLYK